MKNIIHKGWMVALLGVATVVTVFGQGGVDVRPEEQELIEDIHQFVYCYNIIEGITDKYIDAFAYAPKIIQDAYDDATVKYYELRKAIGSRFMEVIGLYEALEPSPLVSCSGRYNSEVNKLVRKNNSGAWLDLMLSPTSEKGFGASDPDCNTSYAKAIVKINRIHEKYTVYLQDDCHSADLVLSDS